MFYTIKRPTVKSFNTVSQQMSFLDRHSPINRFICHNFNYWLCFRIFFVIFQVDNFKTFYLLLRIISFKKKLIVWIFQCKAKVLSLEAMLTLAYNYNGLPFDDFWRVQKNIYHNLHDTFGSFKFKITCQMETELNAGILINTLECKQTIWYESSRRFYAGGNIRSLISQRGFLLRKYRPVVCVSLATSFWRGTLYFEKLKNVPSTKKI